MAVRINSKMRVVKHLRLKARKEGSVMLIQEAELFKGIPSHVVDEIAQFASKESFPEEHVLFREGDSAEFLYILEDGQVAITIQGRETVTFPVDETGSVFGWSALVEPRRYTATAEFTMDSKVIKIDGERMLQVCEQHSPEGFMIMKRLAGVVANRLVKSYQGLTSPRS
jgi:CRP-like cAMP-binding protein